MANLLEVEGIGAAYRAKLQKVGITTTEALLSAGATPAGRKKLAEQSGIGDKLILEWVNHVDLFRINGVGSEYADLLEEVGVDTIPELAQRKADNLHTKMVEINAKKKLVRKLPTAEQVAEWVEQAKKMPRKISY